MLKHVRATGMLALLMLFLVGSTVLPVAAQGQSGNRGGQPEEVAARIAERRATAEANVKEKREDAQLKSQEARQAACERRVANLDALMDRLAGRATSHVAVFDKIYERVQGFYAKGQLTVANYDELKAKVDEAQGNATTEATALNELNTDIDCTDPEVAISLSAFRGSVSEARDALKAYRVALVNLISSLRAEAAEQNTNNAEQESEQETETETEDSQETENETETESENETETEERN